jgi:hypothetical protein
MPFVNRRLSIWRKKKFARCTHGPALTEALEQAAILRDEGPEVAIVDRGYKGVEIDGV